MGRVEAGSVSSMGEVVQTYPEDAFKRVKIEVKP